MNSVILNQKKIPPVVLLVGLKHLCCLNLVCGKKCVLFLILFVIMTLFFRYSTQEESHLKSTPTFPFLSFRPCLFCHSDAGGIALENHSNFSFFVIPTQEESHSKIIHILLQSQHVFSERQISLLFFTNTYEKVFTYNINVVYQLMRFLLCRNDKLH